MHPLKRGTEVYTTCDPLRYYLNHGRLPPIEKRVVLAVDLDMSKYVIGKDECKRDLAMRSHITKENFTDCIIVPWERVHTSQSSAEAYQCRQFLSLGHALLDESQKLMGIVRTRYNSEQKEQDTE